MSDQSLVMDWLQRITYKPDTTISVDYRSEVLPWDGSVTLYVERRLPDSTKAPMTLADYAELANFGRVGTSLMVPPGIVHAEDFDAFVHWVRDELGRLELHERDEWLRINGQVAFDPHKESR